MPGCDVADQWIEKWTGWIDGTIKNDVLTSSARYSE
jgi:hypothetical protein